MRNRPPILLFNLHDEATQRRPRPQRLSSSSFHDALLHVDYEPLISLLRNPEHILIRYGRGTSSQGKQLRGNSRLLLSERRRGLY